MRWIFTPSNADTDCFLSPIHQVRGEIVLEHVEFFYPSRPTVKVLHDFTATFPAGKITALVGASGSGKSSIIGLLERFYGE